MIRKFNYTGRKRIPRSRITITLVPVQRRPCYFDASIDLSELNLPQHAGVFVEAYRRSFFKRFPFGTVGRSQPPENRHLDDQDARALIMFRVKVVDEAARGRILAVADRIIPRRTSEEPADKISILPVEFLDLGHGVWRLDLESDPPSLQLNSKIDEIKEIARSDSHFMALVYPEVVRQVLFRIVVDDDHTDPEADPDDWMSQWLVFSTNVLGSKELPPSGASEPVRQEKLKWIDDVVEAFCATYQTLEKFIQIRQPREQ
jgi:hypothetical protein